MLASIQNPRDRAAHIHNDAHSTHSHAGEQSVTSYTWSPALRNHSPPPTSIHSLPLEVLGEILILALPTNQELYDKFYRRKRELINSPLVFCAVCSSWRFLAFSTPRLWVTVVIHIPLDINRARAQRKAAGLVQWIERARQLPITLYISCSDMWEPPKEGPEAVISVINDHAARWESLYSPDFPSKSSSFQFDGWQSLQRLCYSWWDPVACANETVPWAHLTHLEIRISITCWDATMIFMKCPKLVYLSIYAMNPPTIGPGQSTVPIILEDLAIFALETHQDNVQTLADRLSLPSLRKISINEISARDIQSLLNLLTRSSCSLDELNICGFRFSSGDYLDILTHSSCDSLTSLTLQPSSPDMNWSIDEELLRRLTLHQNDTVCHHLIFLSIGYRILPPLHSALLNMVESRIKSHTGPEPGLQYLRLYVECLENTAEMDKVGRRSGLEYSRESFFEPGHFSFKFRRQGFREPTHFTTHFSHLFWS